MRNFIVALLLLLGMAIAVPSAQADSILAGAIPDLRANYLWNSSLQPRDVTQSSPDGLISNGVSSVSVGRPKGSGYFPLPWDTVTTTTLTVGPAGPFSPTENVQHLHID